MSTHEDDKTEYLVVINQEEQYSIWPAGRIVPAGWSRVGEAGPKAKCLEYIDQHWTDMRPRSLREFMERQVK
ncbi:MAG TPA: MbtH family NRPS accessory protein [Terriglobia bacterium]|nr:MbtH family NRPS accessory protein [Terriglobia bacterium]